ncbi:MAG: hypothetical protein NC319_06380 [Butyricicoccus sp.]|nr:hypothetical protein [Butyricicoccus sp.]
MGTVGTFDGFTTARLGIYAAYKGLSLTGNNIANINTAGYTRQVLDQVSLKTGANDTYRSQYDNHIGNGTLVTGINQIRDPYLDIRYRNTSADVGYYDETLNGLQQLASILDEVGLGEGDSKGDGMLYAQLQDLADSLRAISADPCKDNDTLARTSADALVGLFNKYAEKLENLRLDYVDSLNQDVKTVNGILTNIRNLNESIRESDIHGDNALEMRDERNRQIDELSQYMHIKVTYTMEEFGGGLEVERCTIALANDNPDSDVTTDSSILIDGIYGSQIDIPEKLPIENPNYNAQDAADNKNKEGGIDTREAGMRYIANGEYGVALNPAYDPDDPDSPKYVKLDAAGKVTEDPAEYTDDIDKAAMVDNDNYIVTISKLYDSRGEEWTKPVTTWENLGGNVGVKAKYTYTIENSSGWENGQEITIGGVTYTIGDVTGDVVDPDDPDDPDAVVHMISRTVANNPEKLAKFIAGKLDGKPPYEGVYDVRANGSTIIFTAQNPGVVGGTNGGPANEPNLTLTPDDPRIELSNRKTVRDGKDKEDPVDAPGWPGGTTWDKDGSETEITFIAGEKGWMKCTVITEHTYDVTLDDNDLHGSLQATRELLTENGEFATNETIADVDENAKIKRGIPYYQKSFDLLARTFAEQYNKLNQGFMVNEDGNYINEDGEELTFADGTVVSKGMVLSDQQKENLINNGLYTEQLDDEGNIVKVPDLNKWLKAAHAKEPEGVGVLFSNHGDTDDTEGITAANISISSSWSGGSVKIVPTMVELFGKNPQYVYDENGNVELDANGEPLPNTTQNENVNHMITMINESLLYDPRSMVEDASGTKLFEGSFNDMFSNMNIVLGNDQRKTNIKLSSQYTSLVEIDSSREGVSGVDLNDEAMNMMQYQKAYSAACRLMTAIDEALDRLINNTGIAGR